jgi:predicted nucleotidyltransferase
MRDFVERETIFMTLAGSHMYGTNLPTSDIDKRGVCVPPKNVVMGFAGRFEQQEFPGEDTTVFSLQKFMELAAACNPNIIELLFAPEQSIQVAKPTWQRLQKHRHEFLSAEAFHTFTGYARGQLKRIGTHRHWLLHPPDHKPTREEFGLEETGSGVRELVKGIDASTISDDVMRLVEKERQYKAALTTWNQYEQWKEERNKKRSELEAKYGYDCYLDDTEFLTARGWLRYDEIGDNDRLATLNQLTGALELQHPTERVAKSYSGPIVFFETRATACAVTPNHRMWVSEARGGRGNEKGTAYDPARAAWKIVTAEQMTSGSRYRYHVRTATEGGKDSAGKSLTISEKVLIAVGAYVSEGCVGKRLKDGSPSVLRFSQKAGGRLEPYLERLKKLTPGVRCYASERNEASRTTCITEMVYTLADREVSKKIVGWCGEGSATKHLPSWITGLRKSDARLLLDVLVAGDGTQRRHGRVYYTQSRQLADDVQTLATVAGLTAKVWGPYPDKRQPNSPSMFQVYIGGEGFSALVARGKQAHVHTETVTDRRIVCFTVPNEVLITRRNGKVAIQGNTKHAMHLVRLLRMGQEILTKGTLTVRRHDAQELLAIRNGKWTYDELMAHVDPLQAELEGIYEGKTYVVPRRSDRQALSDLCVELHEFHWSGAQS